MFECMSIVLAELEINLFLFIMKLPIIFFLILTCQLANAQSERTIYSSPVTTGCFRQPVLPIHNPLTLHTDMPIGCLLGYIYLDSLCRANFSKEQIDSLLNEVKGGDTLAYFLRTLYDMVDYNAVLFTEYANYSGYLDSSYRTMPSVFSEGLKDRFREIFGKKAKENCFINAAVILHIKITAVWSSEDTLASNPIHPLPLQCVSAQILDTIKGKHLMQCESLYHLTQDITPCIDFSFSPLWEKEGRNTDHLGLTLDSLGNPVVPCQNCYGNSSVVQDSEYVVFLNCLPLDYNGTTAFYNYYPMLGYSQEGGIFRISNGKVIIPSNYFGYGKNVLLSTFLSSLRSDISSLRGN
jgi:hypothetical protein